MNKSLIKRVTAAAAALAMCLGAAGCGDGDTPSEPVTIEIWHYYNGSLQNSFDKMVDQFNSTVGAENNITVVAHSQGSVSDLETAVLGCARGEVGSGSLPNIFASYADTAYEIEKTGLLADLDQYFTAEEQAEYVDSYIEEGRIGQNGELYIFPVAKSSETFMLNKTDWEPFAAATGAEYTDLATIEGLAETAKKYYEWTERETGTGKAFYGRDALANLFIIGSKQLGHEIFRVENGQVTVDLDKNTMRKIWDRYYIPYINGYYTAGGKYRSDDAKVGNIIALVGSTASAVYFPSEVADENGSHAIEAEILPMPMFEDGSPVLVQQGAGMVVTKASPEEEEASVMFLKWFTETDNNIEFSAESGYLPVKKAANDYDHYTETAGRLGVEIDAVTDKVIKETFRRVAEAELYTSKAFEGGQEARAVLENSLAEKASADREAVLELIAGGTSPEDAAAQFDTEENFDNWYENLRTEVYAAAGIN